MLLLLLLTAVPAYAAPTAVIGVKNLYVPIPFNPKIPPEQQKIPPIPWYTQDVKVTIPDYFSLGEGQTAYITNDQRMQITLQSIIKSQVQMECLRAPCPPTEQTLAKIKVSTPGGCGSNADPRCLGAPAFSQEYKLKEWETAQILGTALTFTGTKTNVAGFKIKFIDETPSTNSSIIMKQPECRPAGYGSVEGWYQDGVLVQAATCVNRAVCTTGLYGSGWYSSLTNERIKIDQCATKSGAQPEPAAQQTTRMGKLTYRWK